ncbi:MAG: hypothetical protein AAF086_03795 [Planctomycetota bacterium]
MFAAMALACMVVGVAALVWQGYAPSPTSLVSTSPASIASLTTPQPIGTTLVADEPSSPPRPDSVIALPPAAEEHDSVPPTLSEHVEPPERDPVTPPLVRFDTDQSATPDDRLEPVTLNEPADAELPHLHAAPTRRRLPKLPSTPAKADPPPADLPPASPEGPESLLPTTLEPVAQGQAGSPPIRLYTWAESSEPQLTNAIRLGQTETPGRVLQFAQRLWADLPPDHRCIMIAPAGKFQGPPFQVPLKQLVVDGPDLEAQRLWWEKILWALEQNDLAPYRVALDWETGMRTWHFSGGLTPAEAHKLFAEVWDDPEAFAKLPDAVKAFSPDQFHFRVNRDAINAWNQYGADVLNDALRQAFAVPLWEKFPDAKITNWRDAHYVGRMERNGWPFEQSGVTDESSLSMYKRTVEGNLARLKPIVDAGGPAPVPWVAYPSFTGYEVWAQTMREAYKLGVREFLYWNPNLKDIKDFPDKAPGDDAFAASIIAELRAIDEQVLTASFD